ncbi:hypothetical protein EFO81_13065 [Lactiplantibacillus plantarum]|uniref:hypothetical protein n=1 Tax=Lactiplantibacillus plantarum TaxID=1590 RepID=UPI0021A2AAA9|nr:hypothetical protein [Lactiplantibacillus plantarum]MCT3223569.1 hypothetical protein [Lactiplantibacillus plantarum]
MNIRKRRINCVLVAVVLTDFNLMILGRIYLRKQAKMYILELLVLAIALGLILIVNHSEWMKTKDVSKFIFLVSVIIIPVVNLMYSSNNDAFGQAILITFMFFGYFCFIYTVPLVFKRYIWQLFLKQNQDDKWKLLTVAISFVAAISSVAGLIISIINKVHK